MVQLEDIRNYDLTRTLRPYFIKGVLPEETSSGDRADHHRVFFTQVRDQELRERVHRDELLSLNDLEAQESVFWRPELHSDDIEQGDKDASSGQTSEI